MEAVRKFAGENLPGLYLGMATPGTELDLEGKRRVGCDAYVLRLRFNGVYLPAEILARRAKSTGMLLSTPMTDGSFQTWLVDRNEPMRLIIHGLERVEVWRQRQSGTLLLRGLEFDEGELQRWPQTWMCGTNLREMQEILGEMSPWLSAKYREVKRAPYPHVRPS